MPTQHPKNSNFAIFVLLGLALSLAMLFFGISCKNSDTSATPENTPAQHSVNSSGIKPEEGNLMYEENPHPGFEDYVHQADYAISQTMQRLFMPAANLRVVAATLNEHGGHAYQQKSIVVYGVKDAPQFVQALRDSLLAWAERATLVKLSEQEAAEYFSDFYKVAAQGSAKLPEGADQSTFCWKIVLDGAVTHTLFITSAAYTEKTPVS
ncbi:hypothetical protein LJB93_03405, partial [Desulfovibrio sp. OttesenSCG-928-F07]|nr:hypothetical protein [Desulfovibrio sp. OttesenSCG-928-F07]